MRKGLLIFLAFFCYKSDINAQVGNSKPQPHAEVFTGTLKDSDAIKRLCVLHDSLRRSKDPRCLDIIQTAHDQSKKVGYKWGFFYSSSIMASEKQVRGQHEEAIKILETIAPYAEQPRNISIASIVYNNLGLSYSALGKYEQALQYYNKGLAVLSHKEARVNGTDSVGLYTNIGVVWGRLEEYNQSIQTFKSAEKIAAHNGNIEGLNEVQDNIALCYVLLNHTDSAALYYNKILASTKENAAIENNVPVIDDGFFENYRKRTMTYETKNTVRAKALAGLAGIYLLNKDNEKALEYYNRALAILINDNIYTYPVLNAAASIGEIYLNLNRLEDAEKILTITYKEVKRIAHKELEEKMEPVMARYYYTSGQYAKAFEHLKNYSAIKDSIFSQEKAKTLNVLLNSRIAEKNKAMLAQQLHIVDQKNQIQKKNFWIGGTALGSLLLLSVSVALVRNYKHKQTIQQSYIHQLQQEQEISQLKAQVRGEEQERERIARELHDNIASQLWAIKLNVESINEGEEDKSLDVIFQQLNDATQDIRKTAHNLMPDLLLEEGLATALASLCEKTGIHAKLEVDFQEYGVVPRMDREIELSIYRMVQELIQNVMKHAKEASSMLVQLSCAGTMLNVTVEDNGKYFDASQHNEGVGLQQIRKRVAAMKGHFDLQSIPGKGTTAYLEFDLEHLL